MMNKPIEENDLPNRFYQTQSPLSPIVKIFSIVSFKKDSPLSTAKFQFSFSDGSCAKRKERSIKMNELNVTRDLYKMHLRLFDMKTNKSLHPLYLTSINVNGLPIEPLRCFRKPHLVKNIKTFEVFAAIDVTDFLYDGFNSIILTTTNEVSNVVAVLCKVHCQPVESLLNYIIQNNTRTTQLFSIDMNQSDDDDNEEVEEGNQVLSLKCPMSFQRMDVPIRGIHCTHLNCFDLNSYIRTSIVKQSFNCPICNKELTIPVCSFQVISQSREN